ncbi:hypothetical protein BVX98_03850 [bacterium F11]|nr:hypothetical protein BVX98_03850 [bacterium F11]
MIKNRYLTASIVEDLKKKMVFVGGPRQVGKTTLAKTLVAAKFREIGYFNWDNTLERKRMMGSEWPGSAELIILDEIHKFKRWKRFVKGEYDSHKEKYKFLVTGSARMDLYRKGGDSLMGRYHYYLLHPFSLAEMNNTKCKSKPFRELQIERDGKGLDVLDKFGGFPEPLFEHNERTLRRWQNERNDRLFREDIRDTDAVRDISTMKLLSDMLPTKVGSLLSINSIREDLEISHRAASHWLDVLESFHYHFRIYPFARNTIRSLKKEPKLFLWDWSEIQGEAARFENLVASHLLKFVHWLQNREGYKAKLSFLRDISQREVDFMVTVNEKPWFAVEVKTQDEGPTTKLNYFRERLKIPFVYQVIKKTGTDKLVDGIRLVSADKFLNSLI